MRCTLHTAHCILHTAYCTLHTAHYTLNTAHCTLNIAYYRNDLTARGLHKYEGFNICGSCHDQMFRYRTSCTGTGILQVQEYYRYRNSTGTGIVQVQE